MSFAHPKMLWLLAVTLPLLGLFLWWSWRRRQVLIGQFVQSRLLAHLTVGLSRGIQKFRMTLTVLAVGLVLLALAQPQWGFAWEEAHQRGLDIVVAVDTSRSMLAEDIAPNRLERAKLAVLDLMHLAKNDRLGLVAFAGTAFLQCPLTLDDEAFRQSVNQLEVGIIPQGGTALAEAIDTAQSAFKDEGQNHKILVLFTDGEDHDSGALEAAERAAHRGLRIFTVGVGTPNGELLRQKDEKGNVAYIKDADGNVVKSRLNESLLTQIANAASGFYVPLSGAQTMDVLYQRGLAPLPKNEIASKLVREYHERFQWPLGLAIVCLIIEVFLPDRKRVPRTEAMLSASNAELRKVVAALLLVMASWPSAMASSATALRKYQAGDYKDSQQEYLRLLQRKPDDLRLQYNAGAAAYQARKFDEAAKHFSTAVAAQDLQLQEQAYYNLGDSHYRMGEGEPDLSKRSQAWEQSIKDYEAALKLNARDQDAQFNLEFVQKKLEELKQQQKQQQKQQKQQQNKDKDPKDQDQQSKEDQSQNKDSQSKSNPKDQEKNSRDQKNPEQSQGEKQPQKPNPSESPRSNPPQNEDKGKQDRASQPERKEGEGSPTNATASASSALPGQMTPEQVKQLLDSQKDNEKAMIFIPPEKLKSRKAVIKDW